MGVRLVSYVTRKRRTRARLRDCPAIAGVFKMKTKNIHSRERARVRAAWRKNGCKCKYCLLMKILFTFKDSIYACWFHYIATENAYVL